MPSLKYMAAPVPRFLRFSRLAYLPPSCVIGSRLTRGDAGNNLYFDIIMLPVNEFTRMKSNVGLQHIIAPALKAGPTFNPGFVLSETREVVVPDDEPDPEVYAKKYFLGIFGVTTAETAAADPAAEKSDYATVAGECTVKPKEPET